jgi:hypothetical protein
MENIFIEIVDGVLWYSENGGRERIGTYRIDGSYLVVADDSGGEAMLAISPNRTRIAMDWSLMGDSPEVAEFIEMWSVMIQAGLLDDDLFGISYALRQ